MRILVTVASVLLTVVMTATSALAARRPFYIKPMPLTEDFVNVTFYAAEDGAVLDCADPKNPNQHHMITGIGSEHSIEVIGKNNVTIKNCTIKDFANGVYLQDAAGAYVEGNTITGSKGDGTDNRGIGVVLVRVTSSYFAWNTVQGNDREGIHLDHANDNLLEWNTVIGNKRDGFDLDRSNGNHFYNNEANGNTMNGIELDYCDNNDIYDNDFSGNGHSGVSLDASNSNFIAKNVVVGNGTSVDPNNPPQKKKPYGIKIDADKDEMTGVVLAGSHDNGVYYNDVHDNRLSDYDICKAKEMCTGNEVAF
jgi:parallel beta-helix repeat protein